MRCVHCLRTVSEDNLTEDHWLPVAWYPSTTPRNLEKLSFPACRCCNNRYGKIEDQLQSRLALALDPTEPAAQGIVQSVHRAIDPKKGRDGRDSRMRAARKKALWKDLFPARLAPSYATIPGLGPYSNIPLDDQIAFGVEAESLEAFVQKLVRGLAYIQLERYVESTYEIEMHLLQNEDAHVFTDLLDGFGITLDRSPAIRARIARNPADPISALHEFIIWERFTIYALSSPRLNV